MAGWRPCDAPHAAASIYLSIHPSLDLTDSDLLGSLEALGILPRYTVTQLSCVGATHSLIDTPCLEARLFLYYTPPLLFNSLHSPCIVMPHHLFIVTLYHKTKTIKLLIFDVFKTRLCARSPIFLTRTTQLRAVHSRAAAVLHLWLK